MGLEIETADRNTGLLSQPCAALRGTRCGIYTHRPKCCRMFECHLLQNAQRGAVTVERALEQIADAREQIRSEEHTSELQSLAYLVCRLLLEKKKPSQL